MSGQERPFDLITVSPGKPWSRIYDYTYGAAQFNCRANADARFSPFTDAAGKVIGSLYLGETDFTAACETVFRKILDDRKAPQTLNAEKLRATNLAVIACRRELKLIDLRTSDSGSAAFHLAKTINYKISQARAKQLMDAYPEAQGLIWYSRLDPVSEACVVFEHRTSQSEWGPVDAQKQWLGCVNLVSGEGLVFIEDAIATLERDRGIKVILTGAHVPVSTPDDKPLY